MLKKTFITLLVLSAQLLAGDLPNDAVVSQKDHDFSVNEITVKPGQKIVFKNDDTVAHNAFSSSPGHEFDLETQKPGEQASISFDTEGDVEVRCAIHPKMKMVIHVKK
jgi:plastocyanin